MRIASLLQETFYRWTGRAELAEARRHLRAAEDTVNHLAESVSGLEARLNSPGWQRVTADAEQEFTRAGLRQLTSICRVMALKNPLIKRAVSLRTAYVWGQGLEISARDGKSNGGQDVNAVVQAFLDDPGNQRTFTGQQAREELERSLATDGNVFLALFTNPRTGRVQIRSLPWDEITDVICNPEDASEPWYYKRVWSTQANALTGARTEQRIAYYPALGHKPSPRPLRLKDPDTGTAVAEVVWDAPVVHVKVGGHRDWKFGVPDVYAAIDWARAYREFLTDWATLIKSLSRFAWRLSSRGSKQAAAAAQLAAAPSIDPVTGEPRFAGATAITAPDMALDAIPKSGATIDSESGRPLAAMVAAATDVPVTMLLTDPGVTGARATAETLDPPTQLMAKGRRALWTEITRAILNYVIAEAVRAPEGTLRGKLVLDDGGRETLTLRGRAQGTIDISWPDIEQISLTVLIDAITKADQTTYLPPLVIARLLLEALGVNDIDEILQQLSDDHGQFLPPHGAGGAAGLAAVDAWRRGDDPAGLLTGEDPAPRGPTSDRAGRAEPADP
ncbi:hypothetical protein [Spirillospora sp. CA-294931]|uniref:hypothetical protein n=1 Tax=Spirillospora sp. CA-294931 TaxID=3240042 RepID=UPI003D935BAC